MTYHDDDDEHVSSSPPRDPLVDDPPLVLPVELERLTELRRRSPWYREGPVNEAETDVRFLLDLVDRLLGRAFLPGEELAWLGEPDDVYDVRSGPSLFMCGHGDWYVRRVGRPGIVTSFTAGVLDASRLRALLNGREPGRDVGPMDDTTRRR